MRQAETNRRPFVAEAPTVEMRKTSRAYTPHGRGVVLLAGCYVEAGPIEESLPPAFDHNGLPPQTYRFRQLPPGSPAAIEMRLVEAFAWRYREPTMPHIEVGRE